MTTANAMQVKVRNWHRQTAINLGFGQSLLKHRQLQGTVSAPSSTGVIVYTPGGPTTSDETTTDTPVWAMWQQKVPRTTAADDIVPGKTRYEVWVGQFPLCDDNGNMITVADEDWLEDTQTPPNRYKVQNPTVDSSLSYIAFEMERVS